MISQTDFRSLLTDWVQSPTVPVFPVSRRRRPRVGPEVWGGTTPSVRDTSSRYRPQVPGKRDEASGRSEGWRPVGDWNYYSETRSPIRPNEYVVLGTLWRKERESGGGGCAVAHDRDGPRTLGVRTMTLTIQCLYMN